LRFFFNKYDSMTTERVAAGSCASPSWAAAGGAGAGEDGGGAWYAAVELERGRRLSGGTRDDMPVAVCGWTEREEERGDEETRGSRVGARAALG